MKRGGPRQGSGRPTGSKKVDDGKAVTVVFTTPQERWITAQAERQDIKRPEVVRRLIELAMRAE
jgi:hypothetical protein